MKFRSTRLIQAALAAIVIAFTVAPAQSAVEYVRVCTLYGAGFFYVPGTDTCIKLTGYVSASYSYESHDFFVSPNFGVNSSGGYAGFGGTVLFGVNNTPLSVGTGVGVMFGRSNGSNFYPLTGGTYKAETSQVATGDFIANIRLDQAWSAYGAFGSAVAQTKISGDGPGFNASDTRDRWGWAVAGGLTYNLPNLPNVSIGAEYRHIEFNSRPFKIPGEVNISDRMDVATLKLNVAFTPVPPP